MTRLATLDNEALRVEGVGVLAGPWRCPARRLFGTMRELRVDVLYVHRSALEQLGLPAELEPLKDGERRREPHPWLAGAESRASLAPSLEQDSRELLVGAWQDGPGDAFGDARDGDELLAAVVAFRDAFRLGKLRPNGWTFKHTASGTGWRLMHSQWSHGRRAHNLGDRLEQPEPALQMARGQVEVPYGGRWWRLNPHDGWDRPYVHAYDVNGQRLAACSRLPLGVGAPRPVDRATALAAIEAGLPGYHRIDAIEHPWPERIPPIFEPGWHTTPRVLMALQLGIPLQVGESVVWSEAVTYLDPFYEAMRLARNWLLERRLEQVSEAGWRAHSLALGALKQAYLQPLGRLRSAKAAARADRYYRPSWYDHVIGRELAVEYLRLHQLAELGVPVLAVYFDAIVVESDQADVFAAAPKPLELSTQLGKFKPVGSLPTRQAHRALLGDRHDAPADVGRLIKALKAAHDG